MVLPDELLHQITLESPLTDEMGSFPVSSFKALADAGLLDCVLPTRPLDYSKPDTEQLLQLLKQIGSADLSVGRIYEGHINALNLVHLFANEAQKEQWYKDVTERKMLFGVWNTQAADGIRIHALDNGRYRLEGSKTFCSGAGYINRPLITGMLSGTTITGWQMCIIPMEKGKPVIEDPSFWKPLGMRASVSYRMDFTGVELEEKDLLGKPELYYHQPVFSGGAIRFAAVQLGGAEAIFNAAREYLQSLGRIDDVFQRSRMAEMACLLASGNLWIENAGKKTDEWLEDPLQTDRLVAFANMTRTAMEEICLRTIQLAERCVGARGLMRPNVLERVHRDLTFYLRQPAPDATLTAIGGYVLNQKITAHELWR
ncbi:MAG: acyl-CoA dehydrogenase family protein [Chitinophagaceae bacterium]